MSNNGRQLSYSLIAMKIKWKHANPLTKLVDADKQSLYFSARQDPYNLERYESWIQYALKDWKYCWKLKSDAPSLMEAVAKEQKMVVYNQMRRYNETLSINVPIAINFVVLQFYKQPAIYPSPQYAKHLPPWDYPELSWRIHPEESKANRDHPLNKQDKQNYE